MTGKPTSIYLVRHGHVDTGPEKRYLGQSDPPLSPRGQAQVADLAHTWAPVALDRILASDLRRAWATAEGLAAGRQIRVEPCPRIREIALGEWEGEPFATIQARNPQEFAERGRNIAKHRPPGGESFADLYERVIPLWAELRAAGFGTTALVTHVGVIRVILCHVLGLPLEKMFLLNVNHAGHALIIFEGDRTRVAYINRAHDHP